jgi:phenylalanyl-tRNA synthetase beta chain
MKLSPTWLREFVDAKVDDRRMAHDLTSVGIAVESISGEGENAVFEMEIGTNRPDAMNHYGVAREAAVIYNLPLRAVDSKLPAAPGKSDFIVEIGDVAGCARYTSRIVRDVSIKPSPGAIAKRLTLVDQRPINNAADATNYTLWEMGHPTHVFDLDLLAGGKILVRRAFSGESLKTLDGVERKLTPEDLVIADAVKPVALAGVMGGFDTMITDKTHNILIEAAWFDPATIRKSSRRHGLHTDASHRFERGADFEATTRACDRVAVLIGGRQTCWRCNRRCGAASRLGSRGSASFRSSSHSRREAGDQRDFSHSATTGFRADAGKGR